MSRSQTVFMETSAYDLDRLGAPPMLPDISHEREQEQERRERRREAMGLPSEETRKRIKAQEAARRKERQGISKFAVVGYIIVIVMLAQVVLAHVALIEISGEIVQLERQLNTLQKEQGLLQVAYQQVFTQVEVERFAREELGMMEASWGQIGYTSASAGGRVELFTIETPERYGLLERVAGFFGSIMEYLPFGS